MINSNKFDVPEQYVFSYAFLTLTPAGYDIGCEFVIADWRSTHSTVEATLRINMRGHRVNRSAACSAMISPVLKR